MSNWDGDIPYCYDDQEKVFQRYIATNDVNTQLEAAKIPSMENYRISIIALLTDILS